MLDVLTRVSSSRMHQKYRTHILHTLDQFGKKIAVFGSDGRAIHFEDTALLNYRKKKCWDLFLNEIMDVVSEYGITGVHLDNG